MSLWFEIIVVISIPIFLIFLGVVATRLKQNVIANNGIFKQNNKIYKHIMLSGLIDVAKDMFDAGLKFRKKRKEMKENDDQTN